ncbi:MAG TPA: hypothetical protein VM370_04800 [Candidatus Thermoplasmatota archaeon]|nr:hypothetical protein [Candidatus Thermoplasmatota archaeon]
MQVRRFVARFQRPLDPREEALWPRAMAASRALATALTLLLFVAALTVDDLRLFRFNAALWGAALAILVFAFTPPFFASRLVQRAMSDAPEASMTWMENAILRRRAMLGIAIALLAVWMVFFASGRTPRW